MLVPQDRQRSRGAAEVRAARGEAKRALAEIWGAEDKRHALDAVSAFTTAYGAKFGKVVAKVTDDLDELLAFYDFPAEHGIHLRTTNPIESTFATVRHRTKVTRGPGSRAAGLAMAFKLIEAAQDRWRGVNGPHLVALVRAGTTFRQRQPRRTTGRDTSTRSSLKILVDRDPLWWDRPSVNRSGRLQDLWMNDRQQGASVDLVDRGADCGGAGCRRDVESCFLPVSRCGASAWTWRRGYMLRPHCTTTGGRHYETTPAVAAATTGIPP